MTSTDLDAAIISALRTMAVAAADLRHARGEFDRLILERDRVSAVREEPINCLVTGHLTMAVSVPRDRQAAAAARER